MEKFTVLLVLSLALILFMSGCASGDNKGTDDLNSNPSISMKDCGSDKSCLDSAASDCTPAKGYWREGFYFEIRGYKTYGAAVGGVTGSIKMCDVYYKSSERELACNIPDFVVEGYGGADPYNMDMLYDGYESGELKSNYCAIGKVAPSRG